MNNDSGSSCTKIAIAVIGAAAVIAAAIIGYVATMRSITVPMKATQTAEAFTRVSTGPDHQYVELETMAIAAVVYSGQNDPGSGDSKGSLSTARGENGGTQYWLDYEISPSGKPGQAGLEFQFQDVQNLAAYKSIQFTIDFVKPDVQVGFYFENKNENGQGDAVTLSRNMDLENLTITHLENEKYRFRIPLEQFTDTNMSNVSEFGIYVNDDLLAGAGEIMIENIVFEAK